MGAWIEIQWSRQISQKTWVAPHDGCVDWNSTLVSNLHHLFKSHPTMGAWIEILRLYRQRSIVYSRTPRWVRGLKSNIIKKPLNRLFVAPHDGCVDWNLAVLYPLGILPTVAPHDGCVDWNHSMSITVPFLNTSHPTMGAWIEISSCNHLASKPSVAPHDGCVDWNRCCLYISSWIIWSHPTMGAWIEMIILRGKKQLKKRRTPRWVRGLKYCRFVACFINSIGSHPTMGAWIEICWKKRTAYQKRSRTPRWVRGLKFLAAIAV